MTVEIFEMNFIDLQDISEFVETTCVDAMTATTTRKDYESAKVEIRKEMLNCGHARFTVFVKRFVKTPEDDAPWKTTYVEQSYSFTRRERGIC